MCVLLVMAVGWSSLFLPRCASSLPSHPPLGIRGAIGNGVGREEEGGREVDLGRSRSRGQDI